MTEGFRHVDDGRTIVFGRGVLETAGDLVGDGFTLLTTERALHLAPVLASRAADVVVVPLGPVDALAADLRAHVRRPRIVALGGGRVIDVAKAIAAADP